MKFYTKLLLIASIWIIAQPAKGQLTLDGEWGYGVRGSVHIGLVPFPGQAFWSGVEFRFSATAEYREPLSFVNDHVSALGLATFNFYYRGLGNYNDDAARGFQRFSLDAWAGPGLIGGWGTPSEGVLMVHNHANWALALPQPYRHSLLITTRGVMQTVFSPNLRLRFQRLGTAALSLNRLQLAYSNDGGPVIANSLGDGLDRWWTGSTSIRYSATDWLLQVSYDRFTGYQENAFQWSNVMGYKAVLYDEGQARYNRGQYRIDAITRTGNLPLGVSVMLENYDAIDLQNILHLEIKQAFHPTFNPESIKLGIIYDPIIQ